jgi:regulator of nonsense transcripts 2
VLVAACPDEAALSRLDSSIKKNAAFIKRLRQLSADSCKQLLDDIKKLNLSKVCRQRAAALHTF